MTNTSNLLSKVLVIYAEDVKRKLGVNACKSTEELLANFTEYNLNESNVNDEKFIASLDIKSLYHSLKTEDCVEIVRETIETSEIDVTSVNVKEMIFLGKHVPIEDIKKCKLCEYLPTQKKKVEIHKDKSSKCKKSIDDMWTFPVTNPTIKERRLMFGLIMSTGVRLVMNNHVYKFNKITRVQENKGGIGVELTGVLAE